MCLGESRVPMLWEERFEQATECGSMESLECTMEKKPCKVNVTCFIFIYAYMCVQ